MKHGWKKIVLASVLCVVMAFTGCTTTWVTDAENIVAVLIPAATNIITLVALLEGKGISSTDLQLIQSSGTQATADLQLVQSLIAQYQKAAAADQPGIMAQITTLANTIQGNLTALLPALHITDTATQAKITAIVGIVISEINSLVAILPIVHPPVAASANYSGPVVAPTPASPPLSASNFVVSYNATMTAKTGSAALDKATSGLKIHLHSKMVRWATAGILK